MKNKAVAYIRVSSTGQIEGTGLSRQEETVREFAERQGFDLVKIYRDEGVSGTVEGFERPGLAALASEIDEGFTVIVENSDRLARDLLVGEVILTQFRDHGVPVLDCSGVDLTNLDGDHTRTLIRQVLGAVAEFNKSQTVARLRSARKRVKAETGRCEGRKPYDNQEVIRKILELREEGLSFQKIADALNNEEIPSSRGGSWGKRAVKVIVDNNLKAA